MFAAERHSGQDREADGAPFVAHPAEVGRLLHEAGCSDEVVAAGVLHETLEDTDARRTDLERTFGPLVAELVAAVSDDPSIADEAKRKAALRRQVRDAGECAAVIFAADKVSKTHELRVRISRDGPGDETRTKLDHYVASLTMLSEAIPEHGLVEQLRRELDALGALPAPR